ncbi:MAG: hypothetical protein HY093_03070 [Candidatus Liptonbacteria bacterium]|nr:hypothetical protein [Candidatus Liptonbacteria bacterium]
MAGSPFIKFVLPKPTSNAALEAMFGQGLNVVQREIEEGVVNFDIRVGKTVVGHRKDTTTFFIASEYHAVCRHAVTFAEPEVKLTATVSQ